VSRAHRLLFDWDGVIRSLDERRVLLAGAQTPVERYSDDEISLFEARWWRDCDGQFFRLAVKRVLDHRAPTLHRLQMAVLALIVADNQHRKLEAEQLVRAVESLDSRNLREDAEKSKACLIFHTAFGDLETALAAGLRLIELERKGGNSAALLRALRWVSLPMRWLDDRQGAVASLTEAYRQASRLGLRGEMWNAAFYLQGVGLDCEDLELTLKWAPIVTELTPDATAHTLGAAHDHYARARIEFMRGDFERAREHLDQSRAVKTAVSPARGEQSFLALDVLLRVRTGQPTIPARILRRLYQLHIATRDSGVWDFEAAAVVAALIQSTRVAEARTVNDYYMRVRRSRIAKHPTLTSVQLALAR
jgi:tetratricopeptide (TPR) repeat protein